MNSGQQLKKLAAQAGLPFFALENGHYQLKNGGRVVNWWPESKKQTLHVTENRVQVKTERNVTKPSEVIRAAVEPPVPEETTAATPVAAKPARVFKRCDHCKFAGEPETNDGVETHECYRYPPMINTGGNKDYRPIVMPDDWCGEFQIAPDMEARA